jgi:hypothetical protein
VNDISLLAAGAENAARSIAVLTCSLHNLPAFLHAIAALHKRAERRQFASAQCLATLPRDADPFRAAPSNPNESIVERGFSPSRPALAIHLAHIC